MARPPTALVFSTFVYVYSFIPVMLSSGRRNVKYLEDGLVSVVLTVQTDQTVQTE